MRAMFLGDRICIFDPGPGFDKFCRRGRCYSLRYSLDGFYGIRRLCAVSEKRFAALA